MDTDNRNRRNRDLDHRQIIVEILASLLWIVGIAAAIFIGTMG